VSYDAFVVFVLVFDLDVDIVVNFEIEVWAEIPNATGVVAC